MNQFVDVYFGDIPIGIMARDTLSHCGQFEFYPSFLKIGWIKPPLSILNMDFRSNPKVYFFENSAGLPTFLMDVLPGKYARELLRYALSGSAQTPETLTAQSYLSLLGDRGLGAFRFEPSGYPELDATESIDIDLLVKYARHLIQNSGVRLSERRIRELLRCGLFTRGSWPKALVAINDFTGEVLSGQGVIPAGFEAWILKLDGVKNDDTDALNRIYVYYKKALDCGILMAPCRMLKGGHKMHLLCKRFDRNGNVKLHVQSFAALRSDNEDSYEAVFRCMRELRLPHSDMQQFFRRMVFNVLVGNKNDTAEKVMFIYSSNEGWRLAPAFNLKPTPDLKAHALLLGGKATDLTQEDLLVLGLELHIKQAKSIINRCLEVLGI